MLVAYDCLAQLVYIDYFIFLGLWFLDSVYLINVFQECFQSDHQLFIRWSSQELQWFDRIWTKRNSRVRNDVRDKVACGEVIVRSRWVAMGRWHDERYILARKPVGRVRVTLFDVNRGLDRTRQRRVLDHLPQLVDIVAAVVAMLLPYIQQCI